MICLKCVKKKECGLINGFSLCKDCLKELLDSNFLFNYDAIRNWLRR